MLEGYCVIVRIESLRKEFESGNISPENAYSTLEKIAKTFINSKEIGRVIKEFHSCYHKLKQELEKFASQQY